MKAPCISKNMRLPPNVLELSKSNSIGTEKSTSGNSYSRKVDTSVNLTAKKSIITKLSAKKNLSNQKIQQSKTTREKYINLDSR